MLRSWRRLTSFSLLALVLALAGCDQAERGALKVPTGPEPIIGGLLGGSSVEGYTLANDPLLPGLTTLKVSQLIGINGGQISLLGHTLIVPQGAVSKPTLFTLLVLPTGYVEVDLSATVTGLLGTLLDVGSKGFDEPIPVTLSYARSTNVTDPEELVVLRVKGLLGYSRFEVMPSVVDLQAKTVSVQLDHFSRYTLATPR